MIAITATAQVSFTPETDNPIIYGIEANLVCTSSANATTILNLFKSNIGKTWANTWYQFYQSTKTVSFVGGTNTVTDYNSWIDYVQTSTTTQKSKIGTGSWVRTRYYDIDKKKVTNTYSYTK